MQTSRFTSTGIWVVLAVLAVVIFAGFPAHAVKPASSNIPAAPAPAPAHNGSVITPNSVASTMATGRYGCWTTCTSLACSDGGSFCYSSNDCQAWCRSCRSCWAWGCGWGGIYWNCGANCGKCGGSCSYSDATYCKSTYSCYGQCAAKNKGAWCAANYECKSGKCKSSKCQ